MENLDQVLLYLSNIAPWVEYLFIALGTLTVIGTAIDQLIPDEKDNGFMKKIMAVPILGDFLEVLKRFSPFNIKEKK